MLADFLQLPFESYIPPLLQNEWFSKLDPAHGHDKLKMLRIAVIGGGVSGIGAAAHISELGFDCHIFEAGGEERIGGIWTQVNESSGLQISSQFYQPHPSVRWSCEYPKQPEIVQKVWQLWLGFGLREKTTFHCPVQSVTRAGTKWIINDGSDGCFDGIVAAVGTCGPPRSCFLPGQDRFGGDLVHSAQLDNVDVAGKNVVVVGGGASAVEALEYAHDHGAAKVKVLSRVSVNLWLEPRSFANNCTVAQVDNPSMDDVEHGPCFISQRPIHIMGVCCWRTFEVLLLWQRLRPCCSCAWLQTALILVDPDCQQPRTRTYRESIN